MKQKSMLGTLTVYNSEKKVSYQANIDKSELDDTIRNYKEEGRRLEGVFYLNGEIDVIIPSRGLNEQTVRIVFVPNNVSRETSQIEWEAGIDPSEWLRKTTDDFLKSYNESRLKNKPHVNFENIKDSGKTLTITSHSANSPRNLDKKESITVFDDLEPSEFHKKEIDRLANELQQSSFIQQRFTKHY